MRKIALIFFFSLLVGCISNQPEARKPVSYSSGSFLKESAAINKKIVEVEKAEILDIIEKNSDKKYQNSPDGFWFTHVEKSNSRDSIFPKKGDLVVFEYDLLKLNGDTIYSKKDIGVREYFIDQERIFSGLRQGLKLMQEGETVTFLFPSYKAFGYYGDLDRIGSNVPLKSTVTLISIKQNEKSLN